MAKKKPDQTTSSDPKGANAKHAPKEGAGESVGAAEAAKAARSVRVTPRRRSPRPKLKTPSRRSSPNIPQAAAAAPGLAVILNELRGVKKMVQQIASPPTAADSALEDSVDSLRRLLSELIERRMESVVRDLVEVRHVAVSSNGDRARIVDRLDAMLDGLGAIRFAPEPMDFLDPLIHVVADERRDDKAPDGVILKTVQPGYRTARGLVLCKAAVLVNRKA